MPVKKTSTKENPKQTPRASGTNLDFEAKLGVAADALRNNMDAADYKERVYRRSSSGSGGMFVQREMSMEDPSTLRSTLV